ASPSKHTSYSVRMENAVPIVTQAPGPQPLQIQPGLLTQQAWPSGTQQILLPPAWQQLTHTSVQHATVIPDSMSSTQTLANWSMSYLISHLHLCFSKERVDLRAYKFKSSNGVTLGNNHIPGGAAGGVAYRQQRSGPHPLQQQPLNLSQAQQHMVAERNGGHRRQQAYITTQAPYSFHHNSPSHTGNVHPHLAATHLPSQPHLYTYTAPTALGSTSTVAHLVASQSSTRHAVQHGSYPPSIVHQVPVSVSHRVLPSPTLHHSQYQAQFAHQTYISASPASTVYTGYPLSPTKVNQYPYL
ncbi:hypothetical protein XENOCAPTIV_011815, partial [Xenoophorus captivus]